MGTSRKPIYVNWSDITTKKTCWDGSDIITRKCLGNPTWHTRIHTTLVHQHALTGNLYKLYLFWYVCQNSVTHCNVSWTTFIYYLVPYWACTDWKFISNSTQTTHKRKQNICVALIWFNIYYIISVSWRVLCSFVVDLVCSVSFRGQH